ncbi:peptide deformylase [Vagococcus coleopterorum]|uniref:Peptide deformylase n=1 Tax=Vagococcus coleopterorum TaxID=2714946 RepID=A0A6G8AME1_9ENTE|nr:peptide deformylase [Vagococcus coleopterorum]QIL46140.1 peptide deformylase [Vagococcus coleopterorum]
MPYPIVLYPNKILETPTKEVVEITDELIEMLDGMRETMIAHDGIGIAAPQIGQSLRVALVEIDEESGLFEMINPKIIKAKGKDIDVEGCLSFPEVYGTVERAKEIIVRYFDREGEEYEVTATEYFARAIQHELEHLDGKLFTDKIIDKIAPEDLDAYMEERLND